MRRRTGRLTRAVFAAGVVLVGVFAAGAPAGAADEPEDQAGGILLVGVPGLAWTDIDESNTPNMWDLAGSGASGSMSVRTIGSWTCPEAGWASLGAGERAGGLAPRDAQCAAQSQIPAPVESGGGWTVERYPGLVEANSAFNYGARLGSLSEAVGMYAEDQRVAAEEAEIAGEEVPPVRDGTCVAAIGNGAALAAADPEGNLTYWGADLERLPEAMNTCDVVIVDPGIIVGDSDGNAPDTATDYDAIGEDDTDVGTDETATPAPEDAGEIAPEPDPVRARAAAAADEAVGAVTEVMPEDWQLVVAGLADASAPSSLHPVLYSGYGVETGEATSATTGRAGYVQLVDLGPTALAAIGGDVPASMSGRPIDVLADEGRTAAEAVRAGTDETAASTAVAEVGWKFYAALAAAGSIAIGAAVWLLVGSAKWRRTCRSVCVFVAAVPLAGVAAGIPPWWRAGNAELVFWAIIVGVAGLVCALTWLPGLRSGPRPALLVAGATAGLIAIDQVSGATWPLHTPMGYTAQAGARFTGLGNYTSAVFAAAVILLMCLIPWRGRARYIGPVLLAVCAVVIVGAPTLGRDMGGIPTIAAAAVLACLKLWGRRLSIGAIAAACGAAAALFIIAGVLDYLRPEADQTHLGRFVGTVLEGSAGEILLRKAAAALGTIGSPLTWLCVAAVCGAIVIWKRRGPISSDVTAAAVIGLTTAAVIGFAINDSGVAVPAFTITVGFGLLAVAVGPKPENAARTHSDDPTVEPATPAAP